jgi:CheY-like chemotaxis protein
MARDSLCGRRACIIDDNATSRRILEEYGASWGLEAASAAGGAAGLALIKDAAARGAPFDIAMLDLQMPHMDGIEVAQAIAADPVLRTCKIILLTSIGVRGQAEQAKQSRGCRLSHQACAAITPTRLSLQAARQDTGVFNRGGRGSSTGHR